MHTNESPRCNTFRQRLWGRADHNTGVFALSKFFLLADPAVTGDVSRLLSHDRLRGLVRDCAGNMNTALQLYAWNAALGAAFLAPIGAVEVALRNSLSDALGAAFHAPWYDDPSFLAIDPAAFAAALGRAKRHVAAAGQVVGLPAMISQLTFGFWVMLLRPAYARSIWPIVRPAFVPYTRRRRAADAFEPLVAFRNRIAHHRLIYDREPRVMWERLRAGARLLSPNLESWIDHHERVSALLAHGPYGPSTLF